MSCCDKQTVTLEHSSQPFIVGDHWQTNNVKVTTGVAVKQGDLIKVDAANVGSLATDPSDWDYIASYSLTAEQATAMAANGTEMAVVSQGEVNIAAVKLGGVALTTAQYDAARAASKGKNIELRKLA